MAAMFLQRCCSSIGISRARFYASSPTKTAVNVISKHMKDLSEKRDHLLKIRREVKGKALDMAQLEVLRIQPRIVDELDLLRKIYNEIMPAGKISNCPLIIIPKHQREINLKLFRISRIEESLPPGVPLDLHLRSAKSSLLCHIKLLTKVFEDIAWEVELDSSSNTHPRLGSGALRYLLVSNGCEIHCLDLLEREFLPTSRIPANTQLPILATLNLLEENLNLPAPVVLFKWRSKAVLIGGMKLPKADRRFFYFREGDYRSDKGKHTPCLMYRLSLDDAKTSLESSYMGELKKPKTWPIVEVINGQIHVIERRTMSLPQRSSNCCIPSHEVLDRDGQCWVEEIPMPENFLIDSYSVIGRKVYAVSNIDDTGDRAFLVFDSREKKWDVVNSRAQSREYEFRDVWDILDKVRVVSCVGGFPYGDISDALYVLVGVDCDFFQEGITATAFLVNSKGVVLSIQPLPRLLGCVHNNISQGQIIKVEEKDMKKTMCSIITGQPWHLKHIAGPECNYLCINIFSVEELPGAADKVRQVVRQQAKRSDDPHLDFKRHLDFVRVDVVDKHVYRVDPEGGDASFLWYDLQACFL